MFRAACIGFAAGKATHHWRRADSKAGRHAERKEAALETKIRKVFVLEEFSTLCKNAPLGSHQKQQSPTPIRGHNARRLSPLELLVYVGKQLKEHCVYAHIYDSQNALCGGKATSAKDDRQQSSLEIH